MASETKNTNEKFISTGEYGVRITYCLGERYVICSTADEVKNLVEQIEKGHRRWHRVSAKPNRKPDKSMTDGCEFKAGPVSEVLKGELSGTIMCISVKEPSS
jgi:hypothetical protein